jgi:hypothetical protein
MKRLIQLAILVLVLGWGYGCSVYKAVNQPEQKDISVLHKNAVRANVIAELGEPVYTEKTEKGRMDIFKFTQGYSEGVKTSRAVFHGTADVLTLGLWEIVGTPVESVYSGHDVRLEAHYDKHDKLKGVRVLTNNLDLPDKSIMLASDTKGIQSQQQLLQEYKEVRRNYIFNENSQRNPDSYALVIGIRKYRQNPDVPHADLSAMAFAELANQTFGVPQENIILLLNEDASSGQIKAKLSLLNELAAPWGNIYFYYAGHGVPDKNGQAYLLPADMAADDIVLEPSLRLDNIYARLDELNTKEAFVFIDSCFSGRDDKGDLLYKGVAPGLKVKKSSVHSPRLTVMTAGKAADFANDLPDKRQRLFTYYLIKTLSSGDPSIEDAYRKVRIEVKQASLRKGAGYKQIPQLYGNTKAPLF